MFPITEPEIKWVQDAFGMEFDAERCVILRCAHTRDVRASPGSGKTTLLVAKLAVLASKWSDTTRGICVLSHTNVARREIQRRFPSVPALQRLNSYPHFVGTLQSFIDQFFGIPGTIARFGIRPQVIDNEQYIRAAHHEFFAGLPKLYGTANAAIRNFTKQEPPEDWIARVEYQDGDLSLPTIGSTNRPIGPATTTYQQIRAFKERMAKRGYFRFRDMDALGAWYLHSHPNLAIFLQWRFPIVFVDEAQDSVPRQAELVQAAFRPGSTVQRFGDDRQAIYSSVLAQEGTPVAFPSEETLSVRHSHRMSPSVARLVTNVCAGEPEELTGNPANGECKHTVILFTRDCISQVLPTFGKIVAEEIGTGHPMSDVRAVGATAIVRQEDDHKFPSAIGNYWAPFVLPTRADWRSRALIDYLKRAQVLAVNAPTLGPARDCVLDAMIRVLGLQRVLNADRPFTRTALLRWFQEQRGRTRADSSELAKFLADACTQLALRRDVNFGAVSERLLAVLSSLQSGAWNQRVTEFVTAKGQAGETVPRGEAVRADNVFRYDEGRGPVEVEIGTIHSVKGETVRAILVLETFVFSHDLTELVKAGYLKGMRPRKPPRKRLAEHIRRIFVAMSRPTHLVCLAMPKDHISAADQEEMESIGWRFASC